jgi:mono/diheme cytochrome c family protein
MKKFLKIILILLGIVVSLAIIAFIFIEVRGIPSYEAKKIDYKVEVTPERIQRGKKIASMLCANCHMNPGTGALTGHKMLEAPKQFGEIYSQNITQDRQYGIGDWTDGELLYLLRTGIKRDGQYAPPWMAKLPHMSDEDIASVIAFLHSNDPMVLAAAVPDQRCEPSFLAKFLCLVAFKPLPFPDHKIEMPDTNNTVELGRYLVHNLDCYTCHSADFKTNDYLNPPLSAGYFAGGNKPLNKEGKPMVTPNLTPDKETGIGLWSEEKFVTALKTGIVEGQPALRYPMVPFVQLTDREAKAIYAYLQTVPPINHKVERSAE